MKSILTQVMRQCGKASKRLHKLQLQTRAAPKLRRFPRPYKLNVGCGKCPFAGWLNIDLNAALPGVDLIWDLRHGLPVDDATCALIYCEHVLEHMRAEDGLVFLRDCHRALQPGGTLRVAMPSLDDLIQKSYEGTWRDQDWLNWPEHHFIQTRAEMLNISFRWWGHLWLYDREELHRRLREAGFTQIADVPWSQSDIQELRNRESRKDSLLIGEATR